MMKRVKRDISYKELQAFNKRLAQMYLTYGVHKDKGTQIRGNTNEATIAYYLEFGTADIPDRPVIRTYLVSKNKRNELLAQEEKEMARAIKKKSPELFWNNLRGFVQEHIKKRVLAGLVPPNADSTIRRKGFDLPWVDTGQLVFEDLEARVHQ